MTENQAKKIFVYISNKVKDITKILHIAIVPSYGIKAKGNYSLAVVCDGGKINEHIIGFVGAYNNGWKGFVDFTLNKNEKQRMYQKIINKLLMLCKNYDVAIPHPWPNTPILIRKGTTLHQLLIEADLMS